MKKKSFLLISVILSILFTSCCNMFKYSSYIYICDCYHGYIEVQTVYEHKDGSEFLLIAYPEDGYCLTIDNLHICTDKDNRKKYSNFEILYSPYGNEYDGYELCPSKTANENQYIFRATKDAKVTIFAHFTKK